MTEADKMPDLVGVAVHAETRAEANKMDSFPEEGTDDKIVKPGDTGETPLSDNEAVQATQRAIQAEAHGGGTMRDIVSPEAQNDGQQKDVDRVDASRASPT